MKRIPIHVSHFLFANESTRCCQGKFVCMGRVSIRLCVTRTRSMRSASACPAAFVCRLVFYVHIHVEWNKEPAHSANNSSETSSSDTCSFSVMHVIKNRNKSLPGECPKALILHKPQACSPTVLAATARKICAQKRANWHILIYSEKTKRYIQKKQKITSGSLWSHACSISIFLSVAARLFCAGH